VGFAGGGIPEVKVNRLLLNNVDVRGVGWGAYAMARPGFMAQQWRELEPMMAAGIIDPPLSSQAGGATYDLEDFGRALAEMEERRTLGKTVVRVR
jgi:NADPH2:quinone reductase